MRGTTLRSSLLLRKPVYANQAADSGTVSLSAQNGSRGIVVGRQADFRALPECDNLVKFPGGLSGWSLDDLTTSYMTLPVPPTR
ncbi:MAG: hypothetical protein VX346_06325 [Planctomycetota bacterium]|nr:hypothetical protein [Planctomycetota bacterium]